MSEIKVAEALAVATWGGGNEIIPSGSKVDILAIDPGARLGDILLPEGEARTACWVRWWVGGYSPKYRSCDLADLDLTDTEHRRLFPSSS